MAAGRGRLRPSDRGAIAGLGSRFYNEDVGFFNLFSFSLSLPALVQLNLANS